MGTEEFGGQRAVGRLMLRIVAGTEWEKWGNGKVRNGDMGPQR